ncbi:MAG: ATP synthase F1 subunit delta [Tenericutes bacterium]|jgi:F-type H+-transporting ATPase subunit delta|nr:ATP synthase F1 subunit delta [Mycoplasmatota bacterium]
MSISNYAKALFSIAKENNKIDLLTYHFDDFKNTMEKNPNWIKLMDSPMVSHQEKIKMIDELEYDDSFLAFLKMLSEKNRLHYYHEIYPEWIQLSRTYQKIAHLHLYAAKPLSEKQEELLKKVVQPRFPNQTISFHITVDESLIGGLKIVYQGQSLDRSIARELEELYTTI